MRPLALPVLFCLAQVTVGQVWERLGEGFKPGGVLAMVRDSITGDLFVAGSFGILQSDSTRYNGVARWDGQVWHRLNGAIGAYTTGTGAVSPAFAIAQYQGNVVVGGAFDNLDSVSNTDNIGGWNGVSLSLIHIFRPGLGDHGARLQTR